MLPIKKIHVKKGEIIQRKGDRDSHVYGVEKGLLRSYLVDAQGKEHIFMFAPEDWIIADNQPNHELCDLFIDALEDSEVIVFEKKPEKVNDQNKLMKRMAVLQKRVILLMSASAIERYEHFLETYPQIVQRVPQRMIASYLGITPEALSRAKKDQYKK